MLVYLIYVFNFTLANHNKAISRRFSQPCLGGAIYFEVNPQFNLMYPANHNKDYSVVKTSKAVPYMRDRFFVRVLVLLSRPLTFFPN